VGHAILTDFDRDLLFRVFAGLCFRVFVFCGLPFRVLGFVGCRLGQKMSYRFSSC